MRKIHGSDDYVIGVLVRHPNSLCDNGYQVLPDLFYGFLGISAHMEYYGCCSDGLADPYGLDKGPCLNAKDSVNGYCK